MQPGRRVTVFGLVLICLSGLATSVPILRSLALLIPINVTGVVFGLWPIALHQDRLVATIVVCTGVVNVVLGCVLTPFVCPIGMAWAVSPTESTAAVGGFLRVRLNGHRAEVAVLAGAAQVADRVRDLGRRLVTF